MWEITLVGNALDYVQFVILEENLKNTLKDNVIVAITYKNNLYCSIALKNKCYINFVKTIILECIIKIGKEEYFKEKLIVSGNNVNLNKFIEMSIVLINLQEEVDYARVKVKLSKNIVIRSLLKFRLGKLYKVWDRFISYLRYILHDKNNNEIYLEFLKILANNTRSSIDIMYLLEKSEEIQILDKNNKIIFVVDKDDEIGLIVSLISYAPKRIIINCLNTLSCKVRELIRYIFEDRVSVII